MRSFTGVSFSCRRTTALVGLLVVLVSRPSSAQAQAGNANGGGTASAKPQLRSQRISQPPAIDGVLDDVAWNEPPVETGEWLSYNPLYGAKVPQTTKVWIGHDAGLSLFRVPVQRSHSVEHQDLHHPARQHLGRRLGRHQPRRARDRPAVLSPDGQSERRAARHAEQRVGQRGRVAGLRVGQRGTPQRSGLRRRDARAAAVDSLEGWRRRADGDSLLEAREPRGGVRRLAAAGTGDVGVRQARIAVVWRAQGAAGARGHPVDDLRPIAVARGAVALGFRG